MKVPPVNLLSLYDEIKDEVGEAVARVLRSGCYILGPEVEAFEEEFAAYIGVESAIAVANGTDAIELALRAYEIGTCDEVITVAHTAMPTVTAIERAGATPVLVDIEPSTYTIDVNSAERAITLRTKAILPVHLYGHPADVTTLRSLADSHNLILIEDCAQAHGARWQNQPVGTFGQAATFSFYPTKNLGAYGDGGIIITNEESVANRLRRLRNYGQESRFHHIEWGINSRMDEIQAAILRIKLRYLDEHNTKRRQIAAHYDRYLTSVTRPIEHPDAHHVYHLYVIQHSERDSLGMMLQANHVRTQIHYPVPIHLQPSHKRLGLEPGALPVTESIAKRILSLPIYIGMSQEQIETVIRLVEQFGIQNIHD